MEHKIGQAMPGLSEEEARKYDPTSAMELVQKIKAERDKMLEGKLQDRGIVVINYASYNPQAMKKMLFDID